MSYTVLARKYRPQSFEDMVGQEHVSRTLGNALASSRIAHAFLFTGVRGVGKTTTARILAKALNCVEGPTGTPCQACDPCREITIGNDLDVLEIDGASNNSVEDVRRLQETIPFRPSRDRFKVVIVDEVHMLSTGAFNAFLKTLEEPPPHVKFIFATTEIHKVPVTIRSRCQRYDFRLIPQQVIASRVRHILQLESIKADDVAISIVAREAAGSMRDALTLLDQVIAMAGGDLVGDSVSRILGIADRARVHEVARSVLEGDAGACLRAVDELSRQGLEVLHFAKTLLEFMRDLVVLKVVDADCELVELVEEERAQANQLASNFDALEMQRAFSALTKLVDEMGKATSPRLFFEMGLVRLATRPRLLDVRELLGRLDDLEKKLGGSPASPPRTSGAGSSSPRTPTSGTPGVSAAPVPAPSPAENVVKSAPVPETTRVMPSYTAETSAGITAPAPLTEAVNVTGPASQTQPDSQAIAETSRAAAPPPQGDFDTWEAVILHLRESRPALAAVLEHGVPSSATANELVIQFEQNSFFGRQADQPEARDAIATAAEAILGSKPRITIGWNAQPTARGATVAAREVTRKAERTEEAKQKALNHPRVVEAMNVFPEARGNVDVRVDLE